MSRAMTRAAGFALAATVAVAVLLMFFALLEKERYAGPGAVRPQDFRVPPFTDEIRIVNAQGEDVTPPQLSDPGTVRTALDRLGRSVRSSFGDPEPMGVLYRVELRSTRGSSGIYELNDLRGTGSTVPAKLYPANPGPNEVWALSGELASLLLDTAAPA